MNVNLEAEQVVKEEEESAPGKKRGFKNNKTLMIIGGVVVLEAVILMGLFSFMGGGSSEAAGDPRPTFDAKNFNDVLLKAYKLEVGPVSIYDEAVSGPGADRRYSMSVDVWLKEEAKNELVALEEQNPMAKELLQRMLEREIRAWMLQQGGQQLKNREFQEQRDAKLKEHLDTAVPLLESSIQEVHIHKITAARF